MLSADLQRQHNIVYEPCLAAKSGDERHGVIRGLKNVEKRFDSLLRDFGMTAISRRKLPAAPKVQPPGYGKFRYRERRE